MSGIADEIFGVIKNEARRSLERIEISSEILPTFVVDLAKSKVPGAAKPAAPKGMRGRAKTSVLQRLKPAVAVHTTAGKVEYAPAGKPATPGRKFPLVAASTAGVAALAVGSTALALTQGRRSLAPILGAALIALGTYVYVEQQYRQHARQA